MLTVTLLRVCGERRNAQERTEGGKTLKDLRG